MKSLAEKRGISFTGMAHINVCSLTQGEPYFGKTRGGQEGAVAVGGWTLEKTTAEQTPS